MAPSALALHGRPGLRTRTHDRLSPSESAKGGAVTSLARTEVQALVKRLAEGDRTAIEPSFNALWPVLRRFSARALGNEADAEDAAQQAVTKLFAQVADYDSQRDAVGWALTIAAYECRTVRRQRARRREVGADELLPIADPGAT